MKHEIKLKKERAFSLVEMLVVIAVIGIVAGIAVPSIGSISGKANESKAKRNGQTIASLYNSSRGVGAVYAADTTSGIIDELVLGKAGPELGGSEFKMSSMPEEEKIAAMKYVSYDSDTDLMVFDTSGGQVHAAESSVDAFVEAVDAGYNNYNTYGSKDEAEHDWINNSGAPFDQLDVLFVEHPGGGWVTMYKWKE